MKSISVNKVVALVKEMSVAFNKGAAAGKKEWFEDQWRCSQLKDDLMDESAMGMLSLIELI